MITNGTYTYSIKFQICFYKKKKTKDALGYLAEMVSTKVKNEFTSGLTANTAEKQQ